MFNQINTIINTIISILKDAQKETSYSGMVLTPHSQNYHVVEWC